ncbi:hypothetical protein CA267_001750 [Alteromonas pelagimontana]|uniref:Uncharacterized protein n=1 Tax=Alteromonas pelagimontana TaxID=1858656 RepID=A0A6M4M9X4_9ALTE|nr:hypothetical protein [Alteromonas pelagimontana]QJR79608.1 hypothetical protein CA267_001750 [Alteromonas pelagimontana]
MSFESILNQAAQDCIDCLGEEENIIVSGVTVQAIFSDTEFEGETGVERMTVITVKNADAKFFRRGDTLLVRDRNYTIERIPTTAEPLIDIEVKSA